MALGMPTAKSAMWTVLIAGVTVLVVLPLAMKFFPSLSTVSSKVTGA